MADKDCKDCVDRCKSIFVSWIYLAGILLTLIGTSAALGYKTASDMAGMDKRLTKAENSITVIEDISCKIDTLLSRIK